MEIVNITTEYIKLDQLLKLSGITYSGAEAKEIILEGKVKVNGSVEIQRGKKLRSGDIISYKDRIIKIE
ncbi:MAG: RNA-binding S4 domain-containing protein [Clostridia bacterium]|nr:RNA-binding S4 domain-containing protein [Clostridia bacterium]